MLPHGPGSTAPMYFGSGQVGRDWIRVIASFDGVLARERLRSRRRYRTDSDEQCMNDEQAAAAVEDVAD